MTAAVIPILLYHSVSAEPPEWLRPWSVHPRTFDRHLAAIADAGCTPMTVSSLADAVADDEPLPERPILVTFDDGYADTVRTALPALDARRIVSTVYVTTGAVEGRNRSPGLRLPLAPMLAWSDLDVMEQLGAEVGAHSHTHPCMDTMTSARALDEVTRPKDMLEAALGHRVRSFAYPHGYSSPRVRRMVADAGYDSACGVRNAMSSPFDDRFAMSRLTVLLSTPFGTIQRWILGEGAAMSPGREWRRTQAWRWYRCARAGASSVALATRRGAPR